MALLFTGCAVLNQQKNITSKEELETNEQIMKDYISVFFRDGYAGYYNINNIQFEFVESKANDADMEAIILTIMNASDASKTDPESVPYIKDAKERAQKETNSERKTVLQKEYETLLQEYGKPFDSSFFLKLTAKLQDGKIHKESIKLFLEQESGNGVLYIPAEEILPK